MWTHPKSPIQTTIPQFQGGFEWFPSSPSRIAIPILSYFSGFVNGFRLNMPKNLQKIFVK
jgi:hypothetical protein